MIRTSDESRKVVVVEHRVASERSVIDGVAAADSAIRSRTQNYGIDAPDVVRNLVIGGATGVVTSAILYRLSRVKHPALAMLCLGWIGFSGVPCLVSAGYMVWSSRVGKLQEIERVLDGLALHGDERVLDVGCGRGAMLVRTAKRLDTGKAVGVDIWRSEDQSGNELEATLENARAEGVLDSIEVIEADARDLPFDDDLYDIVVSSLVLHNIDDDLERESCLREIVRVLRPGGRLALLDIRYTETYARILEKVGVENVRRSGRHFLMYPPVRVVTGRKRMPAA